MLDAAGEPLKTMILLGINCGLGSADTARLPVHAIDLQSGWLDFPRPKTGIPRRAKLWPETVAGIRQALDTRPAKMRPDAVGLVFVEADGRPWVRSRGAERLTRELRSMLKPLGLWKPGRAFYGLRRATETVGGTDQAALNMVMGHAAAASDMGAIYRQRVDDARLEAVAERIRSWLWPAGSDAEGGAV
jgi:integrase